MTRQELLNKLTRLEEDKKLQISKIEDKFVEDRLAMLDAYAKANAKFKVGDVIIEYHPLYGPVKFTIIRVESIKAVIEMTSVQIQYKGRELHPDFTESYGVSGCPRYETVSDAHEIKLLTKPMYESYLVVTASGKEIPEKTYMGTLSTAKSILTSSDEEYVIRYGITESGEREEIQKIPNVNKYFRK